jgi:voltage-gated potassium channel
MEVLLVNTFRAIRTLWSDPQFRSLTRLAVIAISSGTIFYWLVEDLRPIDSLYFSVTTLTTVGFGDFSPKTDAGKLFTVVYVLLGVGILLAFLTKVAGQVVVSHLDHQQARNGHGLRDRLARKAQHRAER